MKFELIDKVIEFEEIDSTQSFAKELIKENPNGNILIIAKKQLAGYGRRGEKWSSEKGGLYFTIITRLDISDENISKLSVKIADVVKKTLSVYGIESKIKLPNDVYAKIKGEYKKICGILIETVPDSKSLRYVIFGIGINTNNKIPRDLCKKAVSIKKVLDKEINNEELLNKFFAFFWSDIKTIQCSAG